MEEGGRNESLRYPVGPVPWNALVSSRFAPWKIQPLCIPRARALRGLLRVFQWITTDKDRWMRQSQAAG